MAHDPPGGLDPEAFMRTHWQRKPLLVRKAFPAFRDPLTVREVLDLASSPDASSRLVRQRGAQWSLEHGPFASARFKQLPRRDWTVLVQDTNHFSARSDELLARFDFIPHARIDDVMVSYAVPGGSVGPHVDSYDVFLLQGEGKRRWRISRQEDVAFVPGLDLRILAAFKPEEEWVLEAGDMLYLPPGVAHHGVAETECLTWSIGFRAPTDRELTGAFLDFLRDRLEPEGQYRDPGEAPTRHPAEIPAVLAGHIAHTLDAIRWTPALVREFTGRYLSEPKTHVSFTAPRKPLARTAFARRAARAGIALDARARVLYHGQAFFVNGEALEVAPAARAQLRKLADARNLSAPVSAPDEFWNVTYEWYLQGFVHLAQERA
jgi:50S ribosomal protein L16 3-hydroxylase